jgi:hypothetical protein
MDRNLRAVLIITARGDAGELLAEADRVLAELEDLIRRINRTNAATMLDEQMTVSGSGAPEDFTTREPPGPVPRRNR